MKIRIDFLDKIFSEFIRRRAVKRSGGCERCLSPKEWKQLQACHFHGRARRSVRWDEDNAFGGCMGCHSYLDGQPLEKVEFFKNLLGQEKYDLLNSRMRQTWPKPDKKLLTLYYQNQIEEIND